ncbi:MAG: hypothetical protein C0518_00995 [Opitutus sp.]|nr:hypothetical protein [Opitutus sp.]
MIRVLRTTEGRIWHALLRSIENFDFYHTADYHALEERREGGQAELVIYGEGSRLIAVPLMLREIPRALQGAGEGTLYDARSVYGYIGLLSSRQTDGEMVERFGAAFYRYLSARNVVSVFGRMHPLLDSLNRGPGIGIVEPVGNTVAVPLHEGLEAYERRLSKSHRYEIRRLRELGCGIRHDRELAYLGEFTRMYTETMKRLGAKPHYFYTEDELREMFSSKQFGAQLHVAIQDGVACAMAIIVRCGELLQYHLSCSRDGVARYPATKLLLDSVCRDAISAGVKWFHLGGGVGGRQDSLFAFKLGFGGVVFPFKTWRYIVRARDYERLSLASRADNSAEAGEFFPHYRHESP